MDAITRIEDDLRAVGDELEQLTVELDELCDGVRAKGCVKDLEQMIDETMRQRGELLTTIGEALVGFSGDSSFSKQVTQAIDAIAVTRNQIEEKQTFVARIDAALQAERLADEISSMERSIERKKNQIEEIGAAITQLQQDQSDLESQKREQEAIRGDLTSLTPQAE